MSQYQLQSGLGLSFIKDKETVDFHVKKNDYFGTLATIVKLLQEDFAIQNPDTLKKL